MKTNKPQLMTPSGLPLILVPYKLIGKIQIYEIQGRDRSLTNEERKDILTHLAKVRPDLMAKWNNDLKGKTLVGRNFIGISDEGKLLIEDRDITAFVFSFDPNKNTAMKKLGLCLQQACQLSTNLTFRLKDNRLMYTGPSEDLDDAQDKLEDYLSKHFKEKIFVCHNLPTTWTKDTTKATTSSLSGFSRALIYIGESKRQGTDTIVLSEESVSLPLSSLNLLLKHFKIPYHFDYLGEQIDNLECMLVVARGFLSFVDSSIGECFHTDLTDAQTRLQTTELRKSLSEKDTEICKQTVPPSIVPEKIKAKL